MEINEFIQKFAEIFDDTDATTLSSETKFRELDEWSSLSALALIAMVDEEYDAELKGDDIRNAYTIADLFEVVKAKV